ncbi:MAG: Arc family DNA-binding protein [Clostridiales bacterium]|nr:Arc family DNA-binding protein [Clostridiales bacterium]
MKVEKKEKGKKQILLRLSSSLWEELVKWSEDDFRSLNGQIEYLLTESVKRRKKGKFESDEDSEKIKNL